MSEIRIGEIVAVGNMKFHEIEGGFGIGKKAMSAKDIATIHSKELKFINQNINRNRKRFKDGVDVLDLKLGNFEQPTFEALEYSKQAVANSENIYLLSERGYAKLLKIMDDDLAWEKYDQLVDGYFSMREQLKPDSYMISDPIERAKVWIKEETERQKLRLENAQDRQIIAELQPKASYYDVVLQSKALVQVSKIAKDYGMSAVTFNRLLHELGVQYKMGDTWLLYQEFAEQGYTSSKTFPIDRESGPDVIMHTYWTQKGRLFLYEILKTKKGVLPLIERENDSSKPELRIV